MKTLRSFLKNLKRPFARRQYKDGKEVMTKEALVEYISWLSSPLTPLSHNAFFNSPKRSEDYLESVEIYLEEQRAYLIKTYALDEAIQAIRETACFPSDEFETIVRGDFKRKRKSILVATKQPKDFLYERKNTHSNNIG